jgi:large subunit ribosomal protein L10
MNRQQKELVVQLLRERFSHSPASFIVGYKGLTVNQLQQLRSALRTRGAALKVAKARLMKLAVGDLEDSQALTPYLKDQIGIVFVSDKSPTGVAKVLNDFAKDHEALRLVGGTIEGAFVDQSAIGRIASLPSKEVLLAQLCGTLQAPISRMVFVLSMQLAQLPMVLRQIAEKKK